MKVNNASASFIGCVACANGVGEFKSIATCSTSLLTGAFLQGIPLLKWAHIFQVFFCNCNALCICLYPHNKAGYLNI